MTPKQEAYARGVLFERKTKRQAYRDAYPSSANSKDTTIDQKIVELEKSPKFSLKFEQMREEARKVMNVTRDDVLNELYSVGFSKDYENIKVRDKLTALGMIVDILGYKNAQKVDMTVTEGNKIIKHLHLPCDGMESQSGADC